MSGGSKRTSVVFFGSGPVAAKSLSLLSKNFTIEAIITKSSTEKEMAQALPGTKVYTVINKQELDELVADQRFESRLGILIDFGIIVSQKTIDCFELGIVNSHFSVLPEWRGADPISFAVLSGQKTTGVSLMLIDQGMDTGKVIVTKSISIAAKETTPSLTNKLIDLSDRLLNEYIPMYLNGNVQPRSQSHPNRATYSRKLTKEDGVIDWRKPAVVVEREIRAFIEWPKSRTHLANKDVVITSAHVIDQSGKAGTVSVRDKEVIVQCGKDALSIDTLKPAGKKEMTAEAFLAGHRHLI